MAQLVQLLARGRLDETADVSRTKIRFSCRNRLDQTSAAKTRTVHDLGRTGVTCARGTFKLIVHAHHCELFTRGLRSEAHRLSVSMSYGARDPSSPSMSKAGSMKELPVPSKEPGITVFFKARTRTSYRIPFALLIALWWPPRRSLFCIDLDFSRRFERV